MRFLMHRQMAFSAILAGLIFASDLALPLGVAGGVPYVALVLTGLWFPDKRSILVLGFVGTVLTITGYFLSEPGSASWIVLTNRGLALAAIWMTTILCFQHKRQEEEEREEKSHVHLRTAIDNLQEGFAYFDADDRLVMCNKQYQRLHPLGKKFIKPGIQFEDIIRANVAKENVAEAKGREDEHIQNRMEQHRNPKGPIVRTLANGVSLVISECRTPDGGYCLTMTDVTELKNAEAKLRESESLFRAVFDNSPAKIHIKDVEGRYTLINPKAEKLFGVTNAEGRGKTSHDLFPDRMADGFMDADRTVVELGETIEQEEEWQMEDGSHTYLTVKFPIYNQDGVVAVGAIGTDITERKRVEEELKNLNEELETHVADRTKDLHDANQANQLLRTVAIAANEATSFEDAIQACLDEVCKFNGCPVGHAFKVTDSNRIDSMKIWHLDDPEKFEAFRKVTHGAHFVSGGLAGKALATGKPHWIEDVGKDKSFQRGQLVADLGVKSGLAFPVLAGKEVVAVLEFYSMEACEPDQALLDVMAQVGTQLGRVMERERAEVALRESEQRARRILDNLADGAITITSEGVIDYVNSQTEHIFGYSRKKLIGQNVNMLMPEPNKGSHDGYLSNYLKTGKAKIIGAGREVTGLRKDGTMFPLNLSISETKTGGQTIFTGTMRDISKHKKAERELIEAKLNAEAANRAKSEFLANMSHELRTPLNAIIGFSELTQSQSFGPVGNQKYIEYAIDINQSGIHLLDVINDILDLSAIEAEKLELDTERVGLATLVNVAEQFLSKKANDEGIRIINTVGMDTPLIMADKRRVKQILINLLSNAVKFTNQGGSVTISAGLEADGCMALVIADTGIGMDEAEIAKALEPFGQADSTLSRKYEGTGLGLPLSKSLVESHGGTLGIESTPGKGTTVTIRFPAERVMAGLTAKESSFETVPAKRKLH